VPDLPLEEAVAARGPRGARLDLILLVAPTTPREPRRRIASVARGFLYYVSVTA